MASPHIGVGTFLSTRVTPGATPSVEAREPLVAPETPKEPRGRVPLVVPVPTVPVATAVASRPAPVPTTAIVVAAAVTEQVTVVSGALPASAGAVREAAAALEAAAPPARVARPVVRAAGVPQHPLGAGLRTQVATLTPAVGHTLGVTRSAAAGETVLPGVTVAHAAIRPVAAPNSRRRDTAPVPWPALASP